MVKGIIRINFLSHSFSFPLFQLQFLSPAHRKNVSNFRFTGKLWFSLLFLLFHILAFALFFSPSPSNYRNSIEVSSNTPALTGWKWLSRDGFWSGSAEISISNVCYSHRRGQINYVCQVFAIHIQIPLQLSFCFITSSFYITYIRWQSKAG